MSELRCALIAESAALEREIRAALAPEPGIGEPLLRRSAEAAGAFDAWIFAGRGQAFWADRRAEVQRLAQAGALVVCTFSQAPEWLGEVACEGLSLPEKSAHDAALFRKALVIRLKMGCGRPAERPGMGRPERASGRLVGIAASMGGPAALLSVLHSLGPDTCGILVVQHLTRGFPARFADYLDGLCAMRVKEARDAEKIVDGTIYLAPDERHTTVERRPDGYYARCAPGPRINGVCPAADCLFASLASQAGKDAMGLVLTGMGRDGAAGLLMLRRAGGIGYVQEARSCPAQSMPSEALRAGGALGALAPAQMTQAILHFSRTGRVEI